MGVFESAIDILRTIRDHAKQKQIEILRLRETISDDCNSMSGFPSHAGNFTAEQKVAIDEWSLHQKKLMEDFATQCVDLVDKNFSEMEESLTNCIETFDRMN